MRVPKAVVEDRRYQEREEQVKMIAREGPENKEKLVIKEGTRRVFKKSKSKDRSDTASTTQRQSRAITQGSQVPVYIAEQIPIHTSTRDTVKEPMREPIFQKIVEQEPTTYQSYKNIKPAQFTSSLDNFNQLDLPYEPEYESSQYHNNRYSSSLFKFAQMGMMNYKD